MSEQDAPPAVDRLVNAYINIRNAKKDATAAYKKQDAKYEEDLRTIEAALLAAQQSAGVTGFRINGIGTTYTRKELKLSIAAEQEFFDFVLKEGDLGFFQKRPSVEHVREWMDKNGGAVPPGIRAFSELRVGVQKPKAKAGDESDDE